MSRTLHGWRYAMRAPQQSPHPRNPDGWLVRKRRYTWGGEGGEAPFAVWHVLENGQRHCRVLPWGKGVINLDPRHGCPTGPSYTFPCDRIGGSHISCGAG